MPDYDSPAAFLRAVSDSEDAALMDGIARRDRASLGWFYDRHSPLVFAFCLRSLRNRSDAEDVLLEVFVEVWERSDRYDPARGSPRTYLLNVTRSRIIDCLRARKSRARHERGVAELPDTDGAVASDHGPLSQAASGEEQQAVTLAMRSLTPEQRAALELAFFDALTHAEIAEQLGEPLGTIKSRIRAAIARLREALKQCGVDRV